MTSPTPDSSVRLPEDLEKMAVSPPPSRVDRTMEYTPSTAISGTEIALTMVSALMPK